MLDKQQLDVISRRAHLLPSSDHKEVGTEMKGQKTGGQEKRIEWKRRKQTQDVKNRLGRLKINEVVEVLNHCNILFYPKFQVGKWVVVVAQLVERSLPTPEICSSNPNIGKI